MLRDTPGNLNEEEFTDSRLSKIAEKETADLQSTRRQHIGSIYVDGINAASMEKNPGKPGFSSPIPVAFMPQLHI
jgi:hypothetical protein